MQYGRAEESSKDGTWKNIHERKEIEERESKQGRAGIWNQETNRASGSGVGTGKHRLPSLSLKKEAEKRQTDRKEAAGMLKTNSTSAPRVLMVVSISWAVGYSKGTVGVH